MSSNCKTNLLSNTIILAVIVAAIFLINVSLKLKLAISGIFVAIIVVNIILIFKHCPKKKVSESFKDSTNFHDRFFYDNLVLDPEGDSTWRHPPSNLPLLDPNQIYTPQGTPINVDPKNNSANGYNQVGPSVDGLADSPKSLFTFPITNVVQSVVHQPIHVTVDVFVQMNNKENLLIKEGLSTCLKIH